MYESRAIARYLIGKHDKSGFLIPADPRKKALFEQAMSVQVANFEAYAGVIVRERVFKPMYGLPGDEAKAKENVEILDQKLDVYEKILSKTKYVAGNVSLPIIFLR